MADKIALRLPHNLYLRVLAALEMADAHATAEFEQVKAGTEDEAIIEPYRIRAWEAQSAFAEANLALDKYAVRKFRQKD